MDCLSKIQCCLGGETRLELKSPCLGRALAPELEGFGFSVQLGSGVVSPWEESVLSGGPQTLMTCCCVCEPFHSQDFSFILSLSL